MRLRSIIYMHTQLSIEIVSLLNRASFKQTNILSSFTFVLSKANVRRYYYIKVCLNIMMALLKRYLLDLEFTQSKYYC